MSRGPYKRDGETVYATEPVTEPQDDEEPDGPVHRDKEWLHYQYNILGKPMAELADAAEVDETTILYQMEKHGLDRWDKSEAVSKGRGAGNKLWNEEWLRDQYDNKEKSALQIADELDTVKGAVYNALDRYGIETRTPSEARTIRHEREYGDEEYNNSSWLYHQYAVLGKSISTIAEENGWSTSPVQRALKRYNIKALSQRASLLLHHKKENGVSVQEPRELVSSSGIDASWKDLKDVKRGKYVPYRDRDWLRKQVNKGLSNVEIAEECDVSHRTIYNWMERLGVERNTPGEETYRNPEWLQEKADAGLTIEEIAGECDASSSTISNWVDRLDIER